MPIPPEPSPRPAAEQNPKQALCMRLVIQRACFLVRGRVQIHRRDIHSMFSTWT